MLRDKITSMFREGDSDVQEVLSRVISLEWQKLGYERPHVKDEIRAIIQDVANRKVQE